MFPFGEPVIFEAHLDGAEDSHGNPVDAWASPRTVEGCAFDPGGSVETYEPGRNPVVTSPRVFAPAGTVVGARDRVTVRGRVFQVKGDPGDYRSPFSGWRPGIVVNLEVVSG